MPKIPLSSTPSIPQHINAAPRMTGAPGLNWHTEEGRTIIKVGEQIGQAVGGFGDNLIKYAQICRDTDNKLAAAEDRRQFSTAQNDITKYLAENPNLEDQQKEKYITDRLNQYRDGRKDYLESMSDDFRAIHESEMAELQEKYQIKQQSLIIQGGATRRFDQLKVLLNNAAQSGDYEEYKRLIDENYSDEGGLLSKEQYEVFSHDYHRLHESAQAQALVAANPAEAVKQLEAKDGEKYKNYPNIHKNYRLQLLHSAESNLARQELAADDKFIVSLIDNKPLYATQENLQKAHDDGAISDRQYAKYTEMLTKYNQKLAVKPDKIQQRKELSEQEIEKRNSDAFLFTLYNYSFSSDPDENLRQKKQAWDNAQELTNNPALLLKLEKEIESKAQKDLSGNDEFSTPEGRMIRNFIQDKYYDEDDREFKNLYWDPWGWKKDKSQEFQRARWYEVVNYARHRLKQGVPANQIIDELQTQVSRLQAGKIASILRGTNFTQPGEKMRTSVQDDFKKQPPEGTTGTYHGKRVIFHAGKWEYADDEQ